MKSKYKPYFGIYDNEDYCIKELMSARDLFSDRNTTEKQYDAMIKAISLVVFYCPIKIKVFAEATIIEANMRRKYFEKLWDLKNEN